VKGVSVAFTTCCGLVVEDNIVLERVAAHLFIGNNAKQAGLSASYSGQFAALRNLFSQASANINATDHPLQPLIDALNLKMPVVIEADSVDLIARLIYLVQEYKFPMIIFGAAEAHLVADRLAMLDPVPGILYRARPLPDTFETHRNVENAPIILASHNLTVGIMADSTETARTLRWEAGIMRELGWDQYSAIASITKNVALLYGLPAPYGHIMVGEQANFLLFNGDPLSPTSSLEVNFLNDFAECQAKQP